MKLATAERQITNKLGDRESNPFTIEGNGKAFRILLDGLYTNKIRTIGRELMTNAYDAHLAVGKGHVKFDVQIPSMLNPTFYVRDYGVSMDHNEVMHLYTRVFQSSKDDSNEQVGMLGLGSKSPFCYVDTFTVNAFLDGECRVYVAALDEKGIPIITHVDTLDTNEPNGIKVSLPVQSKDFLTFKKEIEFVSLGFDVKPNYIGSDVQPIEPMYADKGWAIYDNRFAAGEGVYVCQGSVIYPVPIREIPGLDYNSTGWLGYGHSVVLDVPIGDVDVTANREALSLDDRTKNNLKDHINGLKSKVNEYFTDYLQTFPTLLAASKEFVKIGDIFRGVNVKWHGQEVYHGSISLPTPLNVVDAKWNTEQIKSVALKSIDKLVIVLDDPDTKVVRKRQRVKLFADGYQGSNSRRSWNYNNYVFVVLDPKKEQAIIAEMKKVLELKPEQFKKISDLADPGPKPKAATVPGSSGVTIPRTGIYVPGKWSNTDKLGTAKFEPEHYWVPIDKGGVEQSSDSMFKWNKLNQIKLLLDAFVEIGFPQKQLYYFTPQPAAKAENKRKLSVALVEYIKNNEAKFLNILEQTVKHNNVKFPYGLDKAVRAYLFKDDSVQPGFGFPPVFDGIIRSALGETKVNDTVEAGKRAAVVINKKYPLITSNASIDDYKEYINSRRNS